MNDQPPSQTSSEQLTKALAEAKQGLNELEQALTAIFETFSERGIKPTYHLKQAQEKLRRQIAEAHEAGRQVIEQVEQLNELIHTSTLINSSLEIEQVLQEVMDTVIQLTGAERAYLMLYNDRKELEVRAARNWDQETLNASEIGLSQSVIQAALESGNPIVTTNAQTDERFASQASIVFQQLRSIICIPLTLAGKIVGVLYADNRFRADVFKRDIIPILTAFGTQAAIAITNAHVFEQVKDDLEQAQKVIAQLRIEIDHSRVEEQVTQITESGYFKELAEAAKEMRRRKKGQS